MTEFGPLEQYPLLSPDKTMELCGRYPQRRPVSRYDFYETRKKPLET